MNAGETSADVTKADIYVIFTIPSIVFLLGKAKTFGSSPFTILPQ
jgi:hypothetical protein